MIKSSLHLGCLFIEWDSLFLGEITFPKLHSVAAEQARHLAVCIDVIGLNPGGEAAVCYPAGIPFIML